MIRGIDTVAKVFGVQNEWIEELQNRLGIAQEAVQILQTRIHTPPTIIDDQRGDRLDSTTSNTELYTSQSDHFTTPFD